MVWAHPFSVGAGNSPNQAALYIIINYRDSTHYTSRQVLIAQGTHRTHRYNTEPGGPLHYISTKDSAGCMLTARAHVYVRVD